MRAATSALPAAGEVHSVNSGYLLGALYLLESLTSLSGSQVFLPLYKAVEQEQPALCFYISAALGVVALRVAHCRLPDIGRIEAKAAGLTRAQVRRACRRRPAIARASAERHRMHEPSSSVAAGA